MRARNYILSLILIVMGTLVIAAVNEQDDGRTYFNLVQGSINEIGSGYSTSGADTPDNVDGTGFFRIEVPVGAISNSTYTDDGVWWELGNLGISGAILTSVIAGDGLVSDNDPTSPTISVGPGTGIDVTADTVDFDSTEIGSTTWGSSAAITWTYNSDGGAGTNPILTFGNDVVGWAAANWGTDGNISLNGSNQELRFYEGANYVGFEAPALAANQIWVLPNADGGASEFLQTNGSGALTWASAITTAAGSDTEVQFNDGGTAFGAEDTLRFDKTQETLLLGSTASAAPGVSIATEGDVNSGSSITAVTYIEATTYLQAGTYSEAGTDFRLVSTTANTGGGYQTLFSEATSGALSGASGTIEVDIPTGARIIGVQLRVDTLITSGDGAITWTANLTSAGPITLQEIGSNLAFAKNTKHNAFFNPNATNPVTQGEIDITILPIAVGTFSAGVVHAVAYYEVFIPMDNNP